MHSKSDNIDLTINDKADEVIEDIFESLLCRYQISLKESIKGSDFISDYIHLVHFKCYKINLILGGSYIDSPDWRKTKRQQIPLIKMIINAIYTSQHSHQFMKKLRNIQEEYPKVNLLLI